MKPATSLHGKRGAVKGDEDKGRETELPSTACYATRYLTRAVWYTDTCTDQVWRDALCMPQPHSRLGFKRGPQQGRHAAQAMALSFHCCFAASVALVK
jgi:hypothetical protein